MNLVRIILVLLTLIIPTTLSSSTSDTIPPKAVETAQAGIKGFFGTAPREILESDGYLKPSEQRSDVRLGDGYAVYRIEYSKLQDASLRTHFKSALTFLGWAFPAYVRDEPRLSISVRQNSDGSWAVLEWGGDPRPLLEARERWSPAEDYSCSWAFMVDGPWFIMVEKDTTLSLLPIFASDERLLNVSRDDNAQYPLLDQAQVLAVLIRLAESRDPSNRN